MRPGGRGGGRGGGLGGGRGAREDAGRGGGWRAAGGAGGGGGGAPDLDEALPQVDLPLIMPDDEIRPARPPAPPAPPPPPAPPAPRPGPAPRVPAAVALSDDDGAADTATLSPAEPVLTETMAELYLKQGHQQDALRVYQALLAQHPNDSRLKSKVEQLSPGGRKGSGISAQAFLKGIWSGRRSEESTLASAFDAAGPPPGEPSRPAHEHISLDSVFGDGAARRPTGHPAAEAAPPQDVRKAGGEGDVIFSGTRRLAGRRPG